MKLKNKKTGEIVDFKIHKYVELSDDGNPVYAPFKGNIEEWEDYEEPKVLCFINWFGEVSELLGHISDREIEKLKDTGNYFETREEAEKALEKLKAWKRLKDKGFRFEYYDYSDRDLHNHIQIKAITNREVEDSMLCKEDLDLLFGGEE